MARYLVTGGCGFIGSHLCDRLLEQGAEIRILDDLSTGRRENLPRDAEVIVGNVADAALMRRALKGMDGCFHLAAVASVQRSVSDWLGTHEANLTGTISVFDAARENGVGSVVYASSAAVYGNNEAVPLTEQSATRPLSAYGADKLGCELHARVATVVHGVPTTGLRFFNIFGPRQDPHSPYSGVISIFAERILAKREITIFGDGRQTRDFVFVADVVDHLIAAAATQSDEPRVFNVCTGRATNLLELVEVLGEIVETEPKVTFQPARPGDIRASLGAPDLAAANLGVRATTSLKAGLARTLESLRKG